MSTAGSTTTLTAAAALLALAAGAPALAQQVDAPPTSTG